MSRIGSITIREFLTKSDGVSITGREYFPLTRTIFSSSVLSVNTLRKRRFESLAIEMTNSVHQFAGPPAGRSLTALFGRRTGRDKGFLCHNSRPLPLGRPKKEIDW